MYSGSSPSNSRCTENDAAPRMILNFLPLMTITRPGASRVPASAEPTMTQSAPSASSLHMSAGVRMPLSPMISARCRTSAAS